MNFKTIITIIIAVFVVVGVVQAINLKNIALDTEFTQEQINSKDLSNINLGFNLLSKKVNGGSFDVAYTYRKVVPTTTVAGFILLEQTATSSYSVTEYRNCRDSNSKAVCKGNVKTKIVAKIKSLLTRERDLMRDLQNSSPLNVNAELEEINIINADIE